MWKPIYQPEPWPQFVKRKDIIALPLMEQRKKFMQETILFENYLSTLNTVNTVNSSVASSAAAGGGGPLPGGGNTPPPSEWDIEFTINTLNQEPSENWTKPTPSTTVYMCLDKATSKFFHSGYTFMYNFSATGPSSPMTIDWGDGTEEVVTTYNIQDGTLTGATYNAQSHSYASDGEYKIKMKGESVYDMQFVFLPLTSIEKYDPSLAPDLNGLFHCVQWDGWTGDLSSWGNKIGATTMFGMFSQNPTIGWTSSYVPLEIGDWNVSEVSGFGSMFARQSANPPQALNLGSWNFDGVGTTTPAGNGDTQLMFHSANFVSGARYDLWPDLGNSSHTNGMNDRLNWAFRGTPGRAGGLQSFANWDISTVFLDGASTGPPFRSFAQNSGFSDELWGESFVGWAANPSTPINIQMAGQSGGAAYQPWKDCYFEASGSFKTSNFLTLTTAEASASFAKMVRGTGDGGLGWTITYVNIDVS